jgi:hypothetical protein
MGIATSRTTRPTPVAEGATMVHSYLFLRRAVGLIGLALPPVLILVKLAVDGGGLLDSISGYYYTDLRGVFVGAMCSVGVFLLSYRGYGTLDDVAGNIAAVAAIGLALFPTAPETGATHAQSAVGAVHLTCSAVFFLTLAFFCFVLFPRTDGMPTRRKTQRNGVYYATGSIMMLSLVLIAVVDAFTGESLAAIHPVLWLESAAILSFGVAWLTKGEAILRDVTG